MRRLRALIPNALSLSRVLLGMAFVVTYDTSNRARFVVALGIAIVALLTDVADGRLARRWSVSSDAGALIDGLGDKAFYVAIYLAMAVEHPADGLLLWGLIFREVALYTLRTIDGDRTKTTQQLRWVSLTYAFVIRLYFMNFLLEGWYKVASLPVPAWIKFGALFGYIAVVIGYLGLAMLVRHITEGASPRR